MLDTLSIEEREYKRQFRYTARKQLYKKLF